MDAHGLFATKPWAIFWIVCDSFASHVTFTTKVGVSFRGALSCSLLPPFLRTAWSTRKIATPVWRRGSSLKCSSISSINSVYWDGCLSALLMVRHYPSPIQTCGGDTVTVTCVCQSWPVNLVTTISICYWGGVSPYPWELVNAQKGKRGGGRRWKELFYQKW